MAISVWMLRDQYNAANHKEFLVDTDEDFEALPGLQECAAGSKAYSTGSGKWKILNNAGEWCDYAEASSAGGGSGSASFDLDIGIINCGTSAEAIDDLYAAAKGESF